MGHVYKARRLTGQDKPIPDTADPEFLDTGAPLKV